MSVDYKRRRTFAIISHPDAGKTTLTEKLLLAGGAIHMAGAVKTRGDNRRARSDWMKIEQERGISVTSSVMTFEYDGLVCNLLDTPGHEDFSEDTYRTLTAVDSAIMVIDAAKGIENQTRKLFEVCRMRDIPIITFINKVDREGINCFALLDEIQEALTLEIAPIVWPVGMGTDFRGCYDLRSNEFLTADIPSAGFKKVIAFEGPNDPELSEYIPENTLKTVRENLELAGAAYPEFDQENYRAGYMTPVIFGSALKDYGVKQLIDMVAAHAPPPKPTPADTRIVDPGEDKVTGFVFKVQANMDKNHRDRVAFMRLCSGHFKRGMKLHQVRTGKELMMRSPIFFMAQDREIADDGGPGDVIGIPNHGTIRVGDTFTEGEDLRFIGLPAFAPEILRRVRLADMTRVKQLRSALEDFAEEGLVQIFKPALGSQWIVGVVGVLQLEVLANRAKQEYRIEVDYESIPYQLACWLRSDDEKKLADFKAAHPSAIVSDRDGHPVLLAKSAWELDYLVRENADIEFMKTRELT